MAYNLFIAYDLYDPGQNYDSVRQAIQSLGVHHQFQYSLFWVKTDLTPQHAHAAVRRVMDGNDKLLVIEAVSGVATIYSPAVIDFVNFFWGTP